MIIAMRAMRMMQVAVDEVVHVIPMGHAFVSAASSVLVAGFVP
ncbi:MAG: hypothetical protein QM757_12835 [Paludibaculum sp.]